MPETLEQVQEFNPAEYLQKANATEAAAKAGKPAPEPGKPEPEAPKPVAKEAEPPKTEEEHRISRSARREINRAREEAAELRGRLAAITELGLAPKKEAAAKVEADAEPQRKDFPDDAAYNRALGRWDARQEAAKVIDERSGTEAQQNEQKAYIARVQEMDAKFQEDIKGFTDWAEVAAKAAEDEDAIEVNWEENSMLGKLIATSDERARILYFLATSPETLQGLIDLREKGADLIQKFRRLEGRVEKMYTQSDKEAAQASDKSKDESKDRTHPAEAQAGRNSSVRDVPKPRPSSEVTARGGSAPPDEPIPGSRAWMDRENLKHSSRTAF